MIPYIGANRQNYGNKRNLDNIKYIVVHYTANNGDTAKGNANYFKRNIVKASAHYFVDENEIIQSVYDEYVAYSVGGNKYANTNGGSFHKKCTNTNSISIELCNSVNSVPEKTAEKAQELIRSLMQKYNISINNVIRHYDVTGKICPAPYVNESTWAEFKNKIKGKGELTMTQYEELKKQIENLTLALEKANKVYHSWGELPSYASPIIRELYNKGLYQGSSASDLNLPESLMRSLVINYRAGLYK